ncbi:MAG: hypothetical protein OEW75_16300, partial [Cyclobacteriaceae bacterium]|nr:hypothetical protein [Cyclobacteriaceae bacterium]
MAIELAIEKKNRKIGLVVSVGIHMLLLLLFAFLMAWNEQIPPPEPIGMSINFGTSDSGFGNIQPERQNTEQQEVAPQEQENTEQTEESTPVESVEAPIENINESVTEALQKEGPVKVEQKTTPVPVEKKVEEKKPVEEPVKTEEKPVEVKKEERKVQTAYTGPKSDATNTAESQGTKEGTTGDQGSKEGDVNSKTTYGGPGAGGGGFSHNFTGWGTDFRLPDNKPEATGVLEFKIKIDESGDVVGITISKMIG